MYRLDGKALRILQGMVVSSQKDLLKAHSLCFSKDMMGKAMHLLMHNYVSVHLCSPSVTFFLIVQMCSVICKEVQHMCYETRVFVIQNSMRCNICAMRGVCCQSIADCQQSRIMCVQNKG